MAKSQARWNRIYQRQQKRTMLKQDMLTIPKKRKKKIKDSKKQRKNKTLLSLTGGNYDICCF